MGGLHSTEMLLVFYCAHPGLCPCLGPGSVQCVWAISLNMSAGLGPCGARVLYKRPWALCKGRAGRAKGLYRDTPIMDKNDWRTDTTENMTFYTQLTCGKNLFKSLKLWCPGSCFISKTSRRRKLRWKTASWNSTGWPHFRQSNII